MLVFNKLHSSFNHHKNKTNINNHLYHKNKFNNHNKYCKILNCKIYNCKIEVDKHKINNKW